MGTWGNVIALSAGGVLGVNARYWLGLWANRWAGGQFPWATLAINLSGSFAIGFLTVTLARWLPHPNVRLLVLVGFLGGYTTFSTFEYESLVLWERGEPGLALANMAGSVLVGFLAVAAGVGLGRSVTAHPQALAPYRATAAAAPKAPPTGGPDPARPAGGEAGARTPGAIERRSP